MSENKSSNNLDEQTKSTSTYKSPQLYDSFIVIYNDKKYDIANFINKHPGGTKVLIPYKDKDITTAFDHIGHSESAKFMLFKREVGKTEVSQENQDQEVKTMETSKFIIRKMFTEEDKYYFHKVFGLLSLINFMYRYFYVFPKTGTLGYISETNELDYYAIFNYITLAIHMILSSSSLIFHVLTHRIVENPLIIYEEYRIHAILFTFRAILVSLLGMNKHRFENDNYFKITLVLSLLIIHLLVDLTTKKFGEKGTTAVRVRDLDQRIIVYYGKRFYAFYQFAALGSHLIFDKYTADLGFNAVIAIQSSAFLMTLKRKNIIEWYSHAFFYSFALFLSYYYMLYTRGAMFFFHVGLVFFCRVFFEVSKYPLWFAFVVGMYNVAGINERMMDFYDEQLKGYSF